MIDHIIGVDNGLQGYICEMSLDGQVQALLPIPVKQNYKKKNGTYDTDKPCMEYDLRAIRTYIREHKSALWVIESPLGLSEHDGEYNTGLAYRYGLWIGALTMTTPPDGVREICWRTTTPVDWHSWAGITYQCNDGESTKTQSIDIALDHLSEYVVDDSLTAVVQSNDNAADAINIARYGRYKYYALIERSK